MLTIPTDITDKYPLLPADIVSDAIELAAIRAIQSTMRIPVAADLDDNGELKLYALRNGDQAEVPLKGLKNKTKRRLLDEIEVELMRRQAIQEASVYQSIRGSVLPGLIERIQPDGTLEVLIEIRDVARHVEIYATCPLRQQPPHERQTYKPGEYVEFFVTSCLPVSNGKNARVRVLVSRNARELPSRMLSKMTGLKGIKCTKRVPGGFSRIVTQHWIPKSVVNAVGKTLCEHIELICLDRPELKTKKRPKKGPKNGSPKPH